jgi:hypothetical protein
MNLPVEQRPGPDPGVDSLVDRLVDGELPDAERRALLLRLEAESGGWRRCALAFLEAQAWREALGPLAGSGSGAAGPAAVGQRAGRRHRSWRRLVRLSGLAAGLVAAFALGWALHGTPAPTGPRTPLARVAPTAPVAPPSPPQPATPEVRPSRPAERVAALDPGVRRWERGGYRAEAQERLVSMELKGGRKVQIPVREVRFRYVGDRTY